MVICDGCDRGVHLYCNKPPLKKLPDGACRDAAALHSARTGEFKCPACLGTAQPRVVKKRGGRLPLMSHSHTPPLQHTRSARPSSCCHPASCSRTSASAVAHPRCACASSLLCLTFCSEALRWQQMLEQMGQLPAQRSIMEELLCDSDVVHARHAMLHRSRTSHISVAPRPSQHRT